MRREYQSPAIKFVELRPEERLSRGSKDGITITKSWYEEEGKNKESYQFYAEILQNGVFKKVNKHMPYGQIKKGEVETLFKAWLSDLLRGIGL